MPWDNKNNGPWNGGNNPWGQKDNGNNDNKWNPKNKGDDFDKILDQLKNNILKFFSKGPKSFIIGFIVLLGLWLMSGFYTISPEEQGVVLRFGKYVSISSPGLNYHIPKPIEKVIKVPVTTTRNVEVGFRTQNTSSIRNVDEESLMLTGDENIVDINFVVQWFVSDAAKYVFNIRNPDKNIKDSAESVMREVIGKTNIDFALAEGRDQVRQEAQDSLQKILDRNDSGITVSSLLLQKSDPPPAVIDDFKDVQRARADQERLINEAQAYANRIVPEAKGEASKVRESAEAYKQEVIAIADGASKRFLSVYNEYKVAKEVTRRRIYLETMEKVMQNMNKVIIDNDGSSGVLPYLPLPELNKSLKKDSEVK
ncbi:MAG: FtsH protease activity modulator HflK [Pelagibacterales bacterium]|nr:FtsH protease activity modulator HflK [Pelagibacterales bacterium]OUU61858.1 MAG: HflK protein [Alphaproteobacteria bacterium TMED62]|tara:strand:+ start:2213 stop:3316 length:1104 start_codon:yes stop_codon:yes gene_type:complete